MYLKHFGLSKMPFENVCDGEFFYASEMHSEAFSRISYAIENKKSCVLLTGGYGTGKTFVAEKLKSDFSKRGYVFSFTVNPRLDGLGLLKTVFYNFTGYPAPKAKEDVLIALEKFLKDVYKDGKHAVAVVDEAQSIENEDVFEELRLLLNYQNEKRSLITLLLCGQSELNDRIYSNRQFSQRIFLSYSLKPFDSASSSDYMDHRLKIAGASREIFSLSSKNLIYERSGGIARWINNISNMALLEAFSSQADSVSENHVSEAIKSFKE
ncbi:MAG: AAA family ATPase [Elusimicrobia bacterium]|nr:AAA family ATPase [Elusimicrobiota bacterium]